MSLRLVKGPAVEDDYRRIIEKDLGLEESPEPSVTVSPIIASPLPESFESPVFGSLRKRLEAGKKQIQGSSTGTSQYSHESLQNEQSFYKWSKGSIKILLKVLAKECSKFDINNVVIKKLMFRKVLEALIDAGYSHLDANSIKKKWTNLLVQFRKMKSKISSGQCSINDWPYYQAMDIILKYNISQPKRSSCRTSILPKLPVASTSREGRVKRDQIAARNVSPDEDLVPSELFSNIIDESRTQRVSKRKRTNLQQVETTDLYKLMEIEKLRLYRQIADRGDGGGSAQTSAVDEIKKLNHDLGAILQCGFSRIERKMDDILYALNSSRHNQH